MRNREANRKLGVTWGGEALLHCDTPTYLGVTLYLLISKKAYDSVHRLKYCRGNCEKNINVS